MSAGQAGVCVLALTVAAALSPAAFAAGPPGASSCTSCHGAAGPAAALEGRPAREIAAAMAAFRDDARPATVMGRIARGFTESEARAIAEWFQDRRPGGRRAGS
jgi:cytochrome c553